jgi:ribose 5-phosphate isomerase B
MKIALGTDHAGYAYKERIKQHLTELGHEVEDFGTNSPEPCDYPDFICPAAQAAAQGRCDRAIVFGGSGNGETIVANKVPGVRCAVCWNEELARLSRAHNDANVMSIGARTVSVELALKMVDVWLTTPFDGGRHTERIRKIAEIDGRRT